MVRSSRPRPFRAILLAIAGISSLPGRLAPGEDFVVIQPEVRTTLNEQTFRQWAMGGRNLDVVRQRFDTLLALKIEDLDRTCTLSDLQKEKLRLAGHGDMKRFLDRVDDAKRKVVNVPLEPAKLQQVAAELRPFQSVLDSDPFDDSSIFMKTLRSCLTETQAAAHAKAVREKVEFRFRSNVDLVVVMLDRYVGLRGEQRDALKKALLEQTKPPRKSGPYDYYVLLWQLAKLPEPKIRPIFDDAQWRTFKAHLDRAVAMERTLEQGGFLPVDIPPPPP